MVCFRHSTPARKSLSFPIQALLISQEHNSFGCCLILPRGSSKPSNFRVSYSSQHMLLGAQNSPHCRKSLLQAEDPEEISSLAYYQIQIPWKTSRVPLEALRAEKASQGTHLEIETAFGPAARYSYSTWTGKSILFLLEVLVMAVAAGTGENRGHWMQAHTFIASSQFSVFREALNSLISLLHSSLQNRWKRF